MQGGSRSLPNSQKIGAWDYTLIRSKFDYRTEFHFEYFTIETNSEINFALVKFTLHSLREEEIGPFAFRKWLEVFNVRHSISGVTSGYQKITKFEQYLLQVPSIRIRFRITSPSTRPFWNRFHLSCHSHVTIRKRYCLSIAHVWEASASKIVSAVTFRERWYVFLCQNDS